jgi:hypothetical protein
VIIQKTLFKSVGIQKLGLPLILLLLLTLPTLLTLLTLLPRLLAMLLNDCATLPQLALTLNRLSSLREFSHSLAQCTS